MVAILAQLLLVSPAISFAPDVPPPSSSGGSVQRRDVLNNFSIIVAASILSPADALASETKVYSSNARNMGRLNSGDSSGGSIYDNNPTSPKARARRAMVGCKNSSARSLGGESIGKEKLSEKDCNLLVIGIFESKLSLCSTLC